MNRVREATRKFHVSLKIIVTFPHSYGKKGMKKFLKKKVYENHHWEQEKKVVYVVFFRFIIKTKWSLSSINFLYRQERLEESCLEVWNECLCIIFVSLLFSYWKKDIQHIFKCQRIWVTFQYFPTQMIIFDRVYADDEKVCKVNWLMIGGVAEKWEICQEFRQDQSEKFNIFDLLERRNFCKET